MHLISIHHKSFKKVDEEVDKVVDKMLDKVVDKKVDKVGEGKEGGLSLLLLAHCGLIGAHQVFNTGPRLTVTQVC